MGSQTRDCYTGTRIVILPLATRNAEDKLEKERAVNLKRDESVMAILSDWLTGTNEILLFLARSAARII